MILQNLYIKKYSIMEIMLFSALFIVLYIIYLQNKQIVLLTNKIDELSVNSNEMMLRLAEKEKHLDLLINKIYTGQVDTSLISQNNEQLKLYLIIAGGLLLCATGIYMLNNVFHVFSFKKLIPASLYSLIQDFTPFFQTKSTYYYKDNNNHLDILAEVINNKHIKIKVKETNSGDFMNFTDFIYNLKLNSNTNTTTALIDPSNILSITEAIDKTSAFY